MTQWRVRYHRSIKGENGRELFPSGTIIDDLSKVPAGQHDRLEVFDEGIDGSEDADDEGEPLSPKTPVKPSVSPTKPSTVAPDEPYEGAPGKPHGWGAQ